MFPELTNFAYCTFVVYTDFGVEPQEMSFSELEAFRSEVDAAYNKYSNRFDMLS